jgi:signal transduction histidine kinase
MTPGTASDTMLFTNDHPAVELSPPAKPSDSKVPPWKVLVVDDEADIHNITRLVLRFFNFKDRPLQIFDAYSAAEAKAQMITNPDIAIILLDVVMETSDAGLRFVETLREELKLPLPRIILRTGQPGYAPEAEVIRRCDINDYHTKTELTVNRLITVMTASLRAYDSLITIESMRRGLELEVGKRTQELEASNRLKDQLFAVIAHDLRGPVGNVKAFLDILVSADKIEYETIQNEFLEIMRDNANAILNLLDNLLFWARFQQNALVPDMHLQDLTSSIDDAMKLWSGTAKKKNINLVYEGPGTAICHYDRTMISLVVRNLVGNALKFTPAGGSVRILVSEQPMHWRVTISDTGVGMDDEQMQRLREGSFSFSSRGTENEKGSGLGLMLCFDFVGQHGAIMNVTSSPGRGSTFSFDLPKS